MRLLDEFMQWAGTDRARLRAVADRCRALALDHCRYGQLYHACGWSATANRLEKLSGALAEPPSAGPTVQELEREYCRRKDVNVYCNACRSYHSTPRNFAHWQALQCRRPWGEWTRKATPEEIAKFRDGAISSEK
jgi:RecB family exonuclease